MRGEGWKRASRGLARDARAVDDARCREPLGMTGRLGLPPVFETLRERLRTFRTRCSTFGNLYSISVTMDKGTHAMSVPMIALRRMIQGASHAIAPRKVGLRRWGFTYYVSNHQRAACSIY